MATSTTGYDYPTMMQQFYAPKSARGSRLGRGPALASTMVQYGYSQPGTNISVSPTFSNIGNPEVYTEGLSIGDVSLEGFGGSGGGTSTPGPTPSPSPAPAPGPTGGSTGQTSGGTRPAGSGEKVGTTLKTSSAIQEALQKAAQKGQPNAPRVTRGELKSISQQSDLGPRGLRNALYDAKVQVGGKAADFLNRQLGNVGAKPMPKVETKSDPALKGAGGTSKQQPPVVGLINKAGVPGTTNLKSTPSQQQSKPQAPKAEAKKKAEAKVSGGKKKK